MPDLLVKTVSNSGSKLILLLFFASTSFDIFLYSMKKASDFKNHSSNSFEIRISRIFLHK